MTNCSFTQQWWLRVTFYTNFRLHFRHDTDFPIAPQMNNPRPTENFCHM